MMYQKRSYSISRQLIIGCLAMIAIATARAEDPVRIMTGGPSTKQKLDPIKADLEKAAGAPVEITVNPVDVALVAVTQGVVDLAVGPLEETFSSAEKRMGKKLNREDYQWFEISQSALHVGTHPDNAVKSLTREQIKGILSGEIKNWQTINGKNLPITVLIPKNYIAAMKALTQFYLKADASPAAQYVTNKDGLINGIKMNPGAIGFFTAPEGSPAFTPAFLATEVVTVNAMIGRKTLRGPTQKVFDFLKANKQLLNNK